MASAGADGTMNKLQLCQRMLVEGVSSGLVISSTTNQSAILAKVVVWVDTAYSDIQSRHPQWEFLRSTFSISTADTASVYDGPADLGSWRVGDDLVSVYKDYPDEQWMTLYSWDYFRSYQFFGANRAVSGRPSEYAIKPDNSMIVWPVPDDVFTISGEYYKTPHSLTTNTTEPVFPERYHMAIVWRALMLFAAEQEAIGTYSHAEKEFRKKFNALELDQLPKTGHPGALV